MASLPKVSIVVTLVCLAFTSAANTSSQNQASDRADRDRVMLNVTVWNRTGFVKGLNREAFSVSDEKTEKPIEFFENQDVPLSVGILIDNSTSMQPRVERIAEGLTEFVRLGHQDNEYFFLSFSDAPKLALDWASSQHILSRKIDIKPGKGKTALYDSGIIAIEKLREAKFSRRILVLISDGQDSSSLRTFKELRESLGRSDLTLYAIGVLGGADIGSSLGMEGQGVLDELAYISGGASFYPKNRKEMSFAFTQIASELRHLHRIGFRRDPNNPPNKWRRLKVKITPPSDAQEFRKLCEPDRVTIVTEFGAAF